MLSNKVEPARLVAKPSTNYRFWNESEQATLQLYLARFNQLATHYNSKPWLTRKAFFDNWENAASAYRYVTGHLRSVYEPMVEDGHLKHAVRNGWVIRAYDEAQTVLDLDKPPLPVTETTPVFIDGLFDASTHSRRWLLKLSELERMRKGCSLEPDDRQAVERFAFCALKSAGAALEWHISIVLNAVVYMRRFWLTQWANPRAKPNNPRVLVAACLFVSAKLEGANEKLAKTQRQATGLLLERITNALRNVNDVWCVTSSTVLEFEVELLTALNFELIVHHVHVPLKRVIGTTTTQVAQLAWSLVTDLYASDLIFLHTPGDLAYACLVVASTHFNTAVVVAATNAKAAVQDVIEWTSSRKTHGRDMGPAESPTGNIDVKQQYYTIGHATACLLQLAHGSSQQQQQQLPPKRKRLL